MSKKNKSSNSSADSSTTATYKLFPSAKGDLYIEAPKWRVSGSGKFELTDELTQKELQYIYDMGNTQVVYKIES